MYMGEGNEQYRFYDYFMSWTVQYMVDLGFTQAEPFRDYKLQFPIGLMGIKAGEYCFQSAPQYTWRVGPTGTDKFYNNFGEVYANTFPGRTGTNCGTQAMANLIGLSGGSPFEMDGEQDSTTYWFAQMQAAAAAAADSGLPGGQEAWDRTRLSGIHPDYRDNPIWAIVPRKRSGPAISISADPQSVSMGGQSILTWNAPAATNCDASGDWQGSKPIAGTEPTNMLSSSSTFTLRCSNTDGAQSRSAFVLVEGNNNGSGNNASGGGQPGSGGQSSGSGGALNPYSLIVLLFAAACSHTGMVRGLVSKA
jgi:hypothetical protein